MDPLQVYHSIIRNPNESLNDPNPDVSFDAQYGVPVGVIDTELPRGDKGGGKDYSQMNVNVIASLSTPDYYLTYAQTALLWQMLPKEDLFLVAIRGQQYYEAGIIADMDRYSLILSETNSTLPAVSDSAKNAYLAKDGVAYDAANALKQINTQYWIVCIYKSSGSLG